MPTGPAVVLRGTGGPEVLALEQRAVRDPGPGEVLVEVAAAGLNRADVLQRRGMYPAPPGAPADIPGLEFAGTVAAVGSGAVSGVPGVEVGARVMGITGGGAMARYVVVHARELVRVPDSMPLEHAAAIPEVFLTAYDALIEQGGLAIGQTALIHAAGSGVGTAALQLVRACGARAIGTARTPDKLARCGGYGLAAGDAVVVAPSGGSSGSPGSGEASSASAAAAPSNAAAPGFAARVRDLTGGRGCDVILDAVGASYLQENIQSLAERGRLIVIGLLGGAAGTVMLAALMMKRAQIIGTTLRARPLEQKAALARRFEARVVPLFETGRLEPVIDDVLPARDIAEAHARMDRNETFGKLVIAFAS